MTIAASQLAFLPPKDSNALLDWLHEHGDMHKRVAERAVREGHTDLGTYNVYDMADREDWTYFHNQEHDNIAATYNLARPPDLSYLDFDDTINWANWMQAHALVHDNEKKALNL